MRRQDPKTCLEQRIIGGVGDVETSRLYKISKKVARCVSSGIDKLTAHIHRDLTKLHVDRWMTAGLLRLSKFLERLVILRVTDTLLSRPYICLVAL
jgi:hypothetical protein